MWLSGQLRPEGLWVMQSQAPRPDSDPLNHCWWGRLAQDLPSGAQERGQGVTFRAAHLADAPLLGQGALGAGTRGLPTFRFAQ